MDPTSQKWSGFFRNPSGFWDNRFNKRNPKAPDFKAKDGDVALWLDSRDTPPWVPDQLIKAGLAAKPEDDELPF
jgi:hypothetical protein